MAEQNASVQAFPIVGIGASAGGLDALQRFLSVLPREYDFAAVFIQHLSSRHRSLLQELLSARLPSLVIQEIFDGLKAQPGRLYLAPPGKEIRIQKDIFQTTVHPEGLIHLPIDEFLSSLAEDAAERSIAVIFSGAGTDGARGCQAVRTVGGAVFVQEPETAEFSSMPLAAIATGQADAVLSPEDICREILRFREIGAAAVSRENPITPEEYDGFFQILREKTGSRFNHYKKSVVGRRIRRRMYLHGITVVRDYLNHVSANDSEAAHLAADLMIGVTSFFRDRVAWKALNIEAVRKLVDENTTLPVRVWTPASATGEEAYSIAMMLLRELELAGKKRDVQVFATDLNDRALERAREGRYPASIAADVQQEYIQKYCASAGDGAVLVINKDVRESVVFAKQDLLTDPPFSRLDLIICRNFMIYLEPEAQEKCIRLFHYALKEGGFLFLGNAETVGRNSKLFKSIGHKQCRIYRKLETKTASRLPLSVPYATERQAPPPARRTQFADTKRSFTERIQEKLLEEYAPASVAIDQHYEIVYHNGPTNRYLCQPRGVPTQNLLELLPDNLRSRVRGALYRSGREDRPVSIRTSVAGDDNRTRQVSLRITKAAESLYLVVFQERGASSREEGAETVDAAVIEETAIHQLESELAATRSDLQSHIEQLKSLNEELQSSNEEMQAANEELETSREELQSLNEELITVNAQLQGKIEEQDATNNDLNNFLASTNIPTIFLDTHFRVKRFTPAALKLIKLLPSDVGRPIVDLCQENLGPDLTGDAKAVLEQLVPLRQELQLDSAWYVRTTLPYRTADNRIEGVVVTYSDVTELKRAEECTKHLASFPQLNPNPVIEADASGKVIFANPGAERILERLGMDKGDVAVFLPKDLDAILRDLKKNGESSVFREVSIRDRVFTATVQLIPQFNVARIYAYDITDRKRAEEALNRAHAELEMRVRERTRELYEATETVKAERQRFYGVLEMLPAYVVLLTPDYRVSFANRFFRERFGDSRGRRCYEYLFERTEPCPICETYTVLKTNAPHHWEWIGPDGRNYDIFDYPFTDSDGSPLILEIGIDITERKHAEEAFRKANETLELRVAERTTALRESEERLNRSQEIAHLGSWELDLVNDRLYWSDEVYRIFGLQPREFGATYEAFLEAIHPEDRAAVDEAYSSSLREGRDIYEIEHRVVRKATGEIRIVHEKCEHLRDGAGRIVRSVGMVHDITERKQAEREVQKLNDDMAARNVELETANREMESFVYSVSHDLRAPNRSVSGFARIIMEDYADKLDAHGLDYLARIYNGSEKMSQRIEALLHLSKISRHDLERSRVDLSRMASAIVFDLRQTNAARSVEVVIAEGLIASADLHLIKIALSNLFENAWKFTSKTPEARIEFGAVDSLARISDCGLRNEMTTEQVRQGRTVYYVKDNGAGFDPKYADRMFTPFHRLHSEREFEGTGIGLAIVERVIRRHGETVWAEGEVGKGATIYFTL